MRIVAIVLNVVLLASFVVLIAAEGIPTKAIEWLILTLWVLAPVSSLIAILRENCGRWLSLWLERKALEEQKKIEALRK